MQSNDEIGNTRSYHYNRQSCVNAYRYQTGSFEIHSSSPRFLTTPQPTRIWLIYADHWLLLSSGVH
jgi:hypothetical protein